MSEVAATTRAFVAESTDGGVRLGMRHMSIQELGPGDVTIRVLWSSVNYKDALATITDGRVAKISPLIPGIDLAGEIVESEAPGFSRGAVVLAHGYDLGVAHHGGFAEYARVPADWIVPCPDGLTPRQAMGLGTAGFTAGLSVQYLEERGLRPSDGPVLVTGATGGLGSIAVGMLAARGYRVVASTGADDAVDWLRALGAAEIIPRAETSAPSSRPLESQRWAAAVDAVGGPTLAYILRTLRYGGSVAACGNVGGGELGTTVFPFILRGVSLLGVDSVAVPIGIRRELWKRLAADLRPAALEHLITEVEFDGLEGALQRMRSGQVRGRLAVRIGG